jgi:PKD repeat protein
MVALASAVAVVLAAWAPSAGAIIRHLRNGKAVSFMAPRGKKSMRFDSFFSNLDYNGGPVMPSNTLYPVYWAPAGSPAYPAGYQEGVNTYLKDLAHDSGGHENTDSVATQYGDSEGHLANYEVHFGEQLVDTDPYPANGCTRATICLTDAQLQAELSKFVKARGLPTDLEHMYMLLTPPKVEDCFEASGFECSAGTPSEFAAYCAYHSNAPQSDGSQLIYTNDPFVGGNKGCDDGNHPNGMSDSAIEGGLSHEHNEAITDPVPNTAWTDFGGEGGESADKCRTFVAATEFGTPLGEVEREFKKFKYNQLINGDHYWYQQEYSNQKSECLQRFTLAGSLPTAAFTAEVEPGNKVKVNATGSTTGAGVHYNWQFNDEEPFNTPTFEPVETAFPVKEAEHTYFRPCRYKVALTVFAADGTSAGTAKTVTVGELIKPEPELFVATPSPKAEAPVQFIGGPLEDEDGIITKLEWNFGDGSPIVNALAPKHTYSAGGTYEVTLQATDICGESESIHAKLVVAGLPGGEGGGGGGGGGGGVVPPPPAPPAPPAPALTGKITLPTTIASRRDGRSKVKLTCTGTAASCSGELVLSVKQVVRVNGHKRTRTVVIGSIRFTIPTGQPTTVTLRLSSKGKALLRAGHGHLKALLTLKQSTPAAAKGSVGVRVNRVGK